MADKKTVIDQKTHPHNIQIEQALIAALITVEGSYESVADIITESDFFAQRHQYIFRVVKKLADNNEPYDCVLVSETLNRHGLLEASGGEAYLMEVLSESASSFYNLENYANTIKDLSLRRQLIQSSQTVITDCIQDANKSTAQLLDEAESKVFKISEMLHNNGQSDSTKSITEVFSGVFEKLNEIAESDSDLIGLSTGFIELDNKTSGLQDSDLIIVAARPSMGKTTFAMNLIENILIKEKDAAALVFSMEMPADSIGMRMISSIGGVHQGRLRSAKMDADEWSKVTQTIVQCQNYKFFIDDSSGLSPNKIRSISRKTAKKNGGKLSCIMIDYLQLMKISGFENNRVGEISEISRSLKALAKEMKCPVIALSQLNRSLENRPNKRPIMSDLRESGAIEQDADIIMFIYRDEVYNKESKDAGTAEVIIGKQRNGAIGTIRLAFEGQYSRFRNLSPEFYAQQEE